MGYAVGVHAFWIIMGEVLGVACAWIWVARPFKEYTDRYDAITVPDYLTERFRDTSHVFRWLSALIILSMVMAYTAAQLTASGKAFDSFLGTGYTQGRLDRARHRSVLYHGRWLQGGRVLGFPAGRTHARVPDHAPVRWNRGGSEDGSPMIASLAAQDPALLRADGVIRTGALWLV